MEALPDLMSYEEALDFLREKEAIGSPLTTAEWAQIPADVRRRAFFSATLTSARVAERMQGYIDEFLDQHKEDFGTDAEHFSAQGRSEFVIKMRELLEKEGFGKLLPDGTINPEINDNDLRDLRSARRLQLIFDTQVEQACSYGQWLEGQDPDVLDIFPAQRFIRVRPVLAPRAYHEEAIDTVRRKDDSKFWIGLNRDFGLPYGPWGFNSGCGVEDVDRDEAEELGVIKPDETPKPQTQHFNEKHQQSTAGLRPELKEWAKKQLEGVADFKGDMAVMLPLESKVDIEGQTDYAEQRSFAGFGDWFKRRKEKPEDEGKSDIVQKHIDHEIKALPKNATNAEKREAELIGEIKGLHAEMEDEYEKAFSQGGQAYADFLKKYEEKLTPYWEKLYKHNEQFLAKEGLLIPQKKRGTITVKLATLGQHYPIYGEEIEPPYGIKKAINLVSSIVNPRLLPDTLGLKLEHPDQCRPNFCIGLLTTHPFSSAADVIHELGHAIEFLKADFLERCAGFVYDRRIGNKELIRLKVDGFKVVLNNIEWALEDHWDDPYTGKIYLSPGNYKPDMSRESFVKIVDGVEVFANGLRRLMVSPAEFKRRDPKFYNFIISLIK